MLILACSKMNMHAYTFMYLNFCYHEIRVRVSTWHESIIFGFHFIFIFFSFLEEFIKMLMRLNNNNNTKIINTATNSGTLWTSSISVNFGFGSSVFCVCVYVLVLRKFETALNMLVSDRLKVIFVSFVESI